MCLIKYSYYYNYDTGAFVIYHIVLVAPTLQKESGTFTYNKGDNMILQPIVIPGLPPG